MNEKLTAQARLIESLLTKAGMSADEMAAAVMIRPDTMRKVLRGYQPASQRILDLMAQVADRGGREDTSQLCGKKPVVRKIPLIGWAQAGLAMDFEDIVEWDEMLSVEIGDPKAIGVRIRGDSMSPRIEDGDIVVLACSDQPQNGDTVVARLKDEGVVCKKFQIIDPRKQLYRFISLNEIYAPIERVEEQIQWIYPVDQLIKRMRR